MCLSFDSNVCAVVTSCTSTSETRDLAPAAPPVVDQGGAAYILTLEINWCMIQFMLYMTSSYALSWSLE